MQTLPTFHEHYCYSSQVTLSLLTITTILLREKDPIFSDINFGVIKEKC